MILESNLTSVHATSEYTFENVSLEKEWTIEFNVNVNPNTVHTKSVYVISDRGANIPITVDQEKTR
ncbi:hypothetical protein N780_09425 [Pontibacillus chungwhensis BH030062]|uniref:Uncharacterized protein n=1 Tax=Pontibacillus chungwhensis BH030062 TaxID=1385513 RepID=A0A0A2UNP3_9BACI|nr:hypothetical protein [Pontibacillus chungwhensis]KGP89862.1 hypothetical protein N780_09425 [Pontibacillus chungwhensis BH030062]